MNLTERLDELKLSLPPAPAPLAAYVPSVRTGNLLHVSGQLPMFNGELVHTGRVPDQVTVEQAQVCARHCVLNALAIADQAIISDWATFHRVVRLGVFVNCTPEFPQQSAVANGASELLVDIFGEPGRHARAAVGVAGLPLNAPVEIEFLFELKS